MKLKFQSLPSMLMVLAALLLTIGTTGCKREGCTDPLSTNYDPDAKKDDGSCLYAPPTLVLHVHSLVGSQAFSTATTYTHTSGRRYKITKAHFYLSGAEATKVGGHAHFDKYLQIVAPNSDYELGEIAAGSYTGVNFNIGVDSLANHSDPTSYASTHALSASSATFDHWSWNSGYIFVKIEGVADTTTAMTGAVNGPFEMHIGGDSFLRSLALTKGFEVPVTGEFEFAINIDWGKALDGVDLRNATTHTMDNMPLAMQVMGNLLMGITAE
jgi:hypothetical protein